MAEKTHTGQRRDKFAWTAEFSLSSFNSSALYYHQTPTRWYGHASAPTQSLPITGQRNMQLPPSLEWHVWLSSSGNNCHAVHRSLSSVASLCDGTVGFLPCPILSAKLYFTLYLDIYETFREKSNWNLHKNAMSWINLGSQTPKKNQLPSNFLPCQKHIYIKLIRHAGHC